MEMIGTSALFVPANRPERVLRAAELAELVIVDLEDAIAPESRASARESLIEIADKLEPGRTIVRINARSTPEFALDVGAVRATGLTTCMVAKTESADDLRAVAPLTAVALIETPLGVLSAASIAESDSCIGLMFGSEDLALELGASQSRVAGRLIDVLETARHLVLLAARSRGRFAIDAVFLDLNDDDGLRAEAMAAGAMGYDAKACIHPGQLETVRRAFQPSETDRRWAESIIAAIAEHTEAVFQFGGEMVDAPVLRRAEAILRRLPHR